MNINEESLSEVVWPLLRASNARSSGAKPKTLDSQDTLRPSCSKAMTMALCHPARAVSCYQIEILRNSENSLEKLTLECLFYREKVNIAQSHKYDIIYLSYFLLHFFFDLENKAYS
ncbi:hypothetical protein GQ588_12285 [Dehalobacter restrictus]|jgi:hypothetical protein|uniref:Uncharacterized protein n=1 Tax=Dehalobacter restrictus TaxID=55583 RepID=A0A857DKN2_9FIRM|nr:hypothetical protein A7D23_05065 [Dehalobacter sp. TeCB1]QHA01363.1 hypothetical protein GQ588_12285 [Dehalobacter restrictus]